MVETWNAACAQKWNRTHLPSGVLEYREDTSRRCNSITLTVSLLTSLATKAHSTLALPCSTLVVRTDCDFLSACLTVPYVILFHLRWLECPGVCATRKASQPNIAFKSSLNESHRISLYDHSAIGCTQRVVLTFRFLPSISHVYRLRWHRQQCR